MFSLSNGTYNWSTKAPGYATTSNFTVYDRQGTTTGFTVAGNSSFQVFLVKNQVHFVIRDGMDYVPYASIDLWFAENDTKVTAPTPELPTVYANNEGRIMFYPAEPDVVYKYRVYALGLSDVIAEEYEAYNEGMNQTNAFYNVEDVNSLTTISGSYVRPVDMVQVCYLKFYGPGAGEAKVNKVLAGDSVVAMEKVARVMTNATFNTTTGAPEDELWTEDVFVLENGTYTYELNGTSGKMFGTIYVEAGHLINATTGQLEYVVSSLAAPEEIKYINNTPVAFDFFKRGVGINDTMFEGDNVYYIGSTEPVSGMIPVTFTVIDEENRVLTNSEVFPYTTVDGKIYADETNINESARIALLRAVDVSTGDVFMPIIAKDTYNTTIIEGPDDSEYKGVFFGDLIKSRTTTLGETTVGMLSRIFRVEATYPGYKIDLTHNHNVELNPAGTTIPVVVVYMVEENKVRFVSYDGNGATGGSLPEIEHINHADGATRISNVEKLHSGESIEVKDSDLTKEGHVFDGWNTQADGKGTPYKAGDEITFEGLTADITLYAQWKKVVAPTTYTVSFDLDGGLYDGANTIDDQTVEAGKPATALNSDLLTKDGYVFAGWLDASGAAFDFTTVISDDVALTASWTAVTPTEVTVTYDAGEVAGASVPRAETAMTGDTFTVTNDRAIADGYVFNGWALNGQIVSGSFTVTGDITLVAQWTALENGYVPTMDDLEAAADLFMEDGYDETYDLNKDGVLDITDLILMAQYVADHIVV